MPIPFGPVFQKLFIRAAGWPIVRSAIRMSREVITQIHNAGGLAVLARLRTITATTFCWN